VEEVAYLIGDLEVVDAKSLSGDGPIRVKVWCKDPATINGSSSVFFNGGGYKITWKVEKDLRQGEERAPRENWMEGNTQMMKMRRRTLIATPLCLRSMPIFLRVILLANLESKTANQLRTTGMLILRGSTTG